MYNSTKSQLDGMEKDDFVFVSQVSDTASERLRLKVYGASSGKLITESSMNALGWWTTGVVH
jgi:hypothetical protein